MNRPAQLARGLAALAVLTALVAGLPWALWHFIGWPLPHQLPTTGQLTRALQQQGIADRTLIDALAVVVWAAWAGLAAALAAELPAVLAGRPARRLPVASAFQPLAGRLLAAIAVAFLTTAPRPAAPAVGALGAALTAGHARPPAVTLLAQLADIQAPPAQPAATSPPPPLSPPRPAPVAAPAGRTYLVQRGDSLWSIAQEQLGDPLRWRALYQLNAGRPQPGGATLTDPHWIDPGWTLLIPAASPAPQASTPAASTPTTSPLPQGPANPSATRPPSDQLPSDQSPAPATSAPPVPGEASPAPPQGSFATPPVQLPSGSTVAGSFAAGVLATVALGRLRRRHAYRYRPPQPGRDLSPAPLRPTLQHLARAAQADELADSPPADPGAAFAVDEQRRLDPGQLDIGVRDGAPVVVDLAELSGLALSGPAVDDVARALAASLLVRAGPGAAEVLCTRQVAARLLPGADSTELGLRQLAGGDELARTVRAEQIARTRRLSAAQALDAARFRQDNPEQPLPLLLVLLDPPLGPAAGRWEALLTGVAQLGVVIVFLGEFPASRGRLAIDTTTTVTAAHPAGLEASLLGARLHRLQPNEAVELLGVVSDAQPPAADGEETTQTVTSTGETGQCQDTPDPLPDAEPWPEPDRRGAAHPPIEVQILGLYQISFHGQAVSTGLRARAKLLLGWSLLRPEGTTVEQIVDTLWPDTPPDRIAKQFWYALGDLRSYFRDHDGVSLDVLEKRGERYRPDPAEIGCDLWEFQTALGHAARSADDGAARPALRRAVEAYRGDLLAGADHPWVEPVREDLHRRAVDAHLRLAELDEHAGQPAAAVDTLQRVIELDCYAEEPYRRLMVLHARRGRPDAVTATWRLLRRHLADLGLEVEEATVRLYRKLTADISQAVPDGHRGPGQEGMHGGICANADGARANR